MRAPLPVGLAFWATVAVPSACAPQYVDAVGALASAEAGQSGSAASGADPGGRGGSTASGGSSASGGADCTGPCCGAPSADRDGDGTPDCEDECADQPDKTEPGVCGCNIPDEDRTDVAGCLGLVATLVHRYAFEGTGDLALDTAGLVDGAAVDPETPPADGALINTALSGYGAVTLGGGPTADENDDDDQYVALPRGRLAGLESVTIEAWLTWYGGTRWQRIFDFGNNDSPVPGLQGGNGTSYLFLTTAAPEVSAVRVAFKRVDYPEEVRVDSKRPFPRGSETHVAVTFDLPTKTLALYLDGALEGLLEDVDTVTGIPMRLDLIDDVYDWIGRSQYRYDAEISASIHEFRIYAVALTPNQIRTSAAAGPNPVFFPNE